MSAQEILEHSFLAVEPDVVLLAADPAHVHLTMQVVFKGLDKLSVKFDFNVETDTAEQVVREMIDEQVLPERYQHHITKEINRILRDLEKPSDSEQKEQARQSIWRRETDYHAENDKIREELEQTRRELERTNEHAREIENKCETYESLARANETRFREAVRSLHELQQRRGDAEAKVENSSSEESLLSSASHPPTATPAPTPSLPPEEHHDSPAARDALMSRILEEYSDDTDIEVFVQDCATAAHRSSDKAREWIQKLKNQDIMTVGDIRELQDEDWAGIGLTVFALRALKNMLKGKKLAGQNISIAGQPQSNGITPPVSATPTSAARLSPPP